MNGASDRGKALICPAVPGKKIYAYLKNFPALPQLLQALKQTAMPTLIYMDGIIRQLQQSFTSPTLRIEMDRLDIQQTARSCDLVITNGNFGTTATILMAGKPPLLLPIVLEQAILARRMRQLRVGLDASIKQPGMFADRLHALLSNEQHVQAARQRSTAFPKFDSSQQYRQIIERIEGPCFT